MGDVEQNGHNPVSVSITSAELEKLSPKSIYFGHQSVGMNIIDGIVDIQSDLDVDLDFVESREIGSKNSFYHSHVGKNGDPISKIQDFARLVDGGIGSDVDIAFFKLCYVDFKSNTDAEAVFQIYRQSMDRVEKEYPQVCFVHVTMPLSVREKGLKTFVKGIIGRPRRGYGDNLKREKFNQLMREYYGETGLIFDLARFESTFPDGSRLEFEQNGEKYYALVPSYSSDGGHLNETGRRIIANNLLHFLLSIE